MGFFEIKNQIEKENIFGFLFLKYSQKRKLPGRRIFKSQKHKRRRQIRFKPSPAAAPFDRVRFSTRIPEELFARTIPGSLSQRGRDGEIDVLRM